MSANISHSMVDSKVLASRGAHGGHVKAGSCPGAIVVTKLKPSESIERETFQGITEAGIIPGCTTNVVNKFQPESVEWETCQSMDKCTLHKQSVNDHMIILNMLTQPFLQVRVLIHRMLNFGRLKVRAIRTLHCQGSRRWNKGK